MRKNIKRVLTHLNQNCYFCGGERLFVEMEVQKKEIVTGEDGKQRVIRHGMETVARAICSNCDLG